MNYIVTALDAEARALIEHRRLKREYSLPYTLYRNEDTLLIVCGMGKNNALMAVSALLGWRTPDTSDSFINIGICGASVEYRIGEALLIHQIIEGDRRYYPDILYPHTLRETSIVCVDTPQATLHEYPVDMESSGVFQAASRFFKLHQMAFVKIVSDHFDPIRVTKEGVVELVKLNLTQIDEICDTLAKIEVPQELFGVQEKEEIEKFKSHFTKTQGDILEDALSYFRLKNSQTALPIIPFPIPDSKRERSKLFETFITTLTT